jgi:flavorubredoxin
MAYAIADGVGGTGIEVEVLNYENHDLGYILPKLFESKSIVMGLPSFKGGIPPELSKILSLIEISGLKNKYLALFTCSADTNSPIGPLIKFTSKLNFELISAPLEVQYAPSEEELRLSFQLGKKIGEKTKNNKD